MNYDISITSWCNANCPSCKRIEDHWSPTIKNDNNYTLHKGLVQKHMKYKIFEKTLERDFSSFKNSTCSFEGELGDAMVHPDVEKFIDLGCKTFFTLKVVTNGGVRNKIFYKSIAEKYKNLFFCFAIDGIDDETNQKYRINVNTKKAYENMIAFSENALPRNNPITGESIPATTLYYNIFSHNWFEIPEIIDMLNNFYIKIIFRVNNRPKFKISKNNLLKCQELYEKYKTPLSEFLISN